MSKVLKRMKKLYPDEFVESESTSTKIGYHSNLQDLLEELEKELEQLKNKKLDYSDFQNLIKGKK